MFLTIIQILIFTGWISFVTYSVFDARKKIRTLAKINDLKVPFECKKCHIIHQYSFEEYTKKFAKCEMKQPSGHLIRLNAEKNTNIPARLVVLNNGRFYRK